MREDSKKCALCSAFVNQLISWFEIKYISSNHKHSVDNQYIWLFVTNLFTNISETTI